MTGNFAGLQNVSNIPFVLLFLRPSHSFQWLHKWLDMKSPHSQYIMYGYIMASRAAMIVYNCIKPDPM